MLERFCSCPVQAAREAILVVDSKHSHSNHHMYPSGVRFMALEAQAIADWELMWAASVHTPVHVFVTVGKAAALLLDFDTAISETSTCVI